MNVGGDLNGKSPIPVACALNLQEKKTVSIGQDFKANACHVSTMRGHRIGYSAEPDGEPKKLAAS
jgi:hypothetical protein